MRTQDIYFKWVAYFRTGGATERKKHERNVLGMDLSTTARTTKILLLLAAKPGGRDHRFERKRDANLTSIREMQ